MSVSFINAPPCFSKFRLGKCDYEHTTCTFSHETCHHGKDCPFQFCGYHTIKDGKTLLYYFKLWYLEQLHHRGEQINHVKLYIEIQEFTNLMWSIRSAFENSKNVGQFVMQLRTISQQVNYIRNVKAFQGLPYLYTNQQQPPQFLLDQIRKNRDVHELMDEFYEVSTKELKIAQTFLNKISNNAYTFEWEGKKQQTYSEWINGVDQTLSTPTKEPKKTSLESWVGSDDLETDESSEESFDEAFPVLN